MRRAGVAALLAAGSFALFAAACGGGTATYQRRDRGVGVAPSLVVERFLRAANGNELITMARLFGTREGPVLELYPRSQVEQRMFVLASLLRHEGYELVGERLVPGRLGEATRIVVRLDKGAKQVVLPFMVVRTGEGGWLIEKIDIERITSGAG